MTKTIITLLIISTLAFVSSIVNIYISQPSLDTWVEKDSDYDGIVANIDSYRPDNTRLREDMTQQQIVETFLLLEQRYEKTMKEYSDTFNKLQASRNSILILNDQMEWEKEKSAFYLKQLSTLQDQNRKASWSQVITNIIAWISGVSAIFIMWRKESRDSNAN